MEGGAGILVALVASVALALAIAAIVVVARPSRRSGEWPSAATRATELERRLMQLASRLEVLEAEVDHGQGPEAPARRGPATPRTAGVAISHVGLVRFDAFEDAGGAQSFALALIDDDGDGVVLTSLHSRQATRLYIKGIRRGVADSPLSAEEVRAMQNAGIAPTV
jgi:hypothetical protein